MLATYPAVQGGKLRALAVSAAKRVSSAPDIPTVAESLPGFETGSFQGVIAPLGTPRDIVQKMNLEFIKVLATAEMRERLAKQGTEVRTDTPEAFGKFIRDEVAKWAKVVKEANVKFD
jgi:tripartite-type tricarboxylate transporter receptor subunit TctC